MEKQEQEIGIVKHYYNHLNVAGVVVTKGSLKVGDKIHVKGHTTDFEEEVSALEKGGKLRFSQFLKVGIFFLDRQGEFSHGN